MDGGDTAAAARPQAGIALQQDIAQSRQTAQNQPVVEYMNIVRKDLPTLKRHVAVQRLKGVPKAIFLIKKL